MKTTGIVLLVLGLAMVTWCTFGGPIEGKSLLRTDFGGNTLLLGYTFIALGGYLVYRSYQKKKEESKKRNWENGN
jgi:hypothetical protein